MKPASSKRKKTLPPPAPPSIFEQKDDQDKRENPMLNTVIVQHFFKVNQFSLSDLKNFRLVCKLWGELVLPSIRQQAWLTVKDALLPGEGRKGQLFLSKLMSVRGEPNPLLPTKFTKYKVIFNQIALASSKGGKLKFWNTFGPLMTHLKLYHHSSSPRKELITVIFEKTPNLEHLTLENSVDSRSHAHTENDEPQVWDEQFRPSAGSQKEKVITLEISIGCISSLSWMYFLARIPNLKTLKLIKCGCTLEKPLLRLLESVLILREQLGLEFTFQLSQLDIIEAKGIAIETFPSNITEILRQLSFPLASLAVQIGAAQDVQSFINLLQPHSNTLEKLVVCRAAYMFRFFSPNFPFGVDLHHLKELVLVGYKCTNLNFLTDLPALKTLVFLDGNGEYEKESTPKTRLNMLCQYLDVLEPKYYVRTKARFVSNPNFLTRKVKKIVLSNMEEFIMERQLVNGPEVEALGRLMPNLKKLRLGMTNDGFRMACKVWKKLQHLDVEPCQVIDRGILGSERGKLYVHPNITDLKELMSLRMSNFDRTPTTYNLSEGSIVHGLLLANRLRDVEVPTASEEVHAMLASKFSL